jgi:hypothetical protein
MERKDNDIFYRDFKNKYVVKNGNWEPSSFKIII